MYIHTYKLMKMYLKTHLLKKCSVFISIFKIKCLVNIYVIVVFSFKHLKNH